MKIINRFDYSYCSFQESFQDSNKTVLIDASILMDDIHENSIAWLIEPPEIIDTITSVSGSGEHLKEILKSGEHKFEKLYTHLKEYASFPNVVIMDKPPLMSWISDDEANNEYVKTTDSVFVTSDKTGTSLQKFRVKLANDLMRIGFVNVYGRNYRGNIKSKIADVPSKATVLGPSRFCFSIENTIHAGYHSEKVLDCFRTKTVPIYIGDPTIGETYDIRGMIVFESVDDFLNDNRVIMLSNGHIMKELYDDMLPYVNNNKEIYENIKGSYHPLTQLKRIAEDNT